MTTEIEKVYVELVPSVGELKFAIEDLANKIDSSSIGEKLGKSLSSKIGNALRSMGSVLSSNIKFSLEDMKNGISAIASGVDLSEFSNKIMETMNGLIANLPLLPQQFAMVIPQLVNSLNISAPALVDALIQTFASLSETLPTVLPLLVEGITLLILQLAPTLITMMPVLLDAGLQLFTALITALTGILPLLIEMLPAFISQISLVLIDNLPLLLEAGLTLFLALVQAFVQMLPTLITQLPLLMGSIADTLIAFLPQLGATAGVLFMAIVQAVPGILGSLITAVGNLLSSIPEKIVSFASNLGEAAKNMMLGMIEGIKNAVGNIIGAIGDVCNDIVNNVKGFFGIQSPSKLMRRLFGYVGEGAALGLSDSTGSVLSAMDEMASDVAKEASALDSGISFGAVRGDAVMQSVGLGMISAQLAQAEMHSTLQSPITKLESAIERSGNATNDVLLKISSLLMSALTDIYNVIPEGESEWDFNRRIRRAIA